MAKKNKKSQALRRQKRAEKSRQRTKRGANQKPKRGARPNQVTEDMFPTEDHVFWVCHGVNYLASNYAEGLWTPLFPHIYEGRLPEVDDIPIKVMAAEDNPFALAWTIHDRNIIWVYVQEAIRRLKAGGYTEAVEDVAKRPHQPLVWEMFYEIQQQWAKRRGEAIPAPKPESPILPEAGPVQVPEPVEPEL